MTFNFDALSGSSAKVSPSAARTAGHLEEGESRDRLRALLVGQPNVGKSVVFGALTGTYVAVSNYPGTTVEITRGHARLSDGPWEIVDTPGTHNLVPMSEDEEVTRSLLISESHDCLIQVGDAKNLSRTLLLSLQLAELGIPFCLDLNMLDEARARGIRIDLRALEQELDDVAVCASTATEGEGIDAIRDYLSASRGRRATASERGPLACAMTFPEDIERAIAAVEELLPNSLFVAKRAIALMLLSGERGIVSSLTSTAGPRAQKVANEHAAHLARAHGSPVFAQLSRLRLSRAQSIVRKVQHRESEQARDAGLSVPWSTAALSAGTAALIAATVYGGALSRARGLSESDPLADYGLVSILGGLFSPSHWRGGSPASLALFAACALLGTVAVRRHARARSGVFKLVASFAAAWLAYFSASGVEAITRHGYSAFPVHLGAAVGLGALGVSAWVGGAADARASQRLGRAAIHPVWGLVILSVVLLFAYKIVGVFGAGTAVDFIENRVFGATMARAPLQSQPEALHDDSPEGTMRLFTQPEGASAVLVSAQVKHGDSYVPEPNVRIDVYAPNARVTTRFDGVLVSGTLQAAEARVWSGYVNRLAYRFFRWIDWPLLTAFFVGPYGLLTMGATYAIAIVLPVVATFFFVFSMLEDSGYLPRLAVMANRGLRGMGLNGKAVLPMVLGLGCDTMATLTARIMESRKERVLVTLLLALGIPCSSQLSVILALMQRTSMTATFVWMGVVALTLIGVGWTAARVLPGETSDFLLEMPPIRQPMLGNIAAKTMARIEWYLKEAVPLFLAGTALLFVLDVTHSLDVVHRIGEPIVHHVLGFRREGGVSDRISEALLVGFLRRDFGAAGMLDLARAGRLTAADTAVSMVTITLFIPCIANVFMMAKERGWRVAGAMSAFIFPYAIAVGAAVRLGFRLIGGPG